MQRARCPLRDGRWLGIRRNQNLVAGTAGADDDGWAWVASSSRQC